MTDPIASSSGHGRMIRDRANSNGSTRAAFYTGQIPERAPKTLTPNRAGKKKARKKKPQTMSEIADAAMASLEEGNRSSSSANGAWVEIEKSEGVSNGAPGASSVLSNSEATSLSSHIPRRSAPHNTGYGSIPETAPHNLEPIRDDSDIMDESDFSDNYQHTFSPPIAKRELSEVSLVGTNWLSESAHSAKDSLRYSTASFANAWVSGGANSAGLGLNNSSEAKSFSSIARGTFGGNRNAPSANQWTPDTHPFNSDGNSFDEYSSSGSGNDSSTSGSLEGISCIDQLEILWTSWLSRHAHVDEDTGKHYFDDKFSLADMIRTLLYNPIAPEFTSLQQFNWAVILGVLMGVYTAFWKWVIETGLEFVWKTVPEWLLDHGVFTDVDGAFPLYHYMWITPAIFAGVLSYVFVVLPIPIPDQNAWIDSVHSRGVQDYRTFGNLFVLSTLGMLSGLSLGPELPLVLTAGMIGSKLGLLCKQSMLQARVFNLTAASAAVGGFFGFPMAGALFVLELPHRMGLQYFEALSPATISSIIAVLVNRLVVGNDVTGYYTYPFLSQNLPSNIFGSAVVYGLFGAFIGIVYAKAVIKGKTLVHDLFHAPHPDKHDDENEQSNVDLPEAAPLLKGPMGFNGKAPLPLSQNLKTRVTKYACCVIPEEKYRAAAAGVVAGALVGIIGMYVPVSQFWGEAQLQHLIDKGRTPLPVFGAPDEPTGDLTALGHCMIDPSDAEAVQEGFSLGCAALIIVSKIAVVGLSLGTGIIGGHFWGPLFVGCAASHLFTDMINEFAKVFGFGGTLATYPCVVILCTMGSAHVVTFRAHMAIMLILTLTISAFNPDGEASGGSKQVAGDYSAVFPLLVVSVFVSLMVSRDTIFYKMQRERGDIMAVPEVLCEPGMEGRPVVVGFESDENVFDTGSQDSDYGSGSSSEDPSEGVRIVEDNTTQKDITEAFDAKNNTGSGTLKGDSVPVPSVVSGPEKSFYPRRSSVTSHKGEAEANKNQSSDPGEMHTVSDSISELDGLDELLRRTTIEPSPEPSPSIPKRRHRRTQSAPIVANPSTGARSTPRGRAPSKELPRFVGARERSNSGSSRSTLVRITSYGELNKHQPSLIEQARLRAASSAADSRHRRVPSLPSGRHSRKNSESSFFSAVGGTNASTEASGALTMEDIEASFNHYLKNQTGSKWTNNI